MKTILTTILVIFISISVYAQGYNTIDINKTLVFKKNNPTNGVKIGDLKSTAIAKFGPPSSTKTQYSDFDEANMDVLVYGNSKLYFLNNKFISLEIPDFDNSPFTIGSTNLKITSNYSSSVSELFTGNAYVVRASIPSRIINAIVTINNQRQDIRLVINMNTANATLNVTGGGRGGEGREIDYTIIEKIKSIYITQE